MSSTASVVAMSAFYIILWIALVETLGWIGTVIMLAVTIGLAVYVLVKNWWLVMFFRDFTGKNVEKLEDKLSKK